MKVKQNTQTITILGEKCSGKTSFACTLASPKAYKYLRLLSEGFLRSSVQERKFVYSSTLNDGIFVFVKFDDGMFNTDDFMTFIIKMYASVLVHYGVNFYMKTFETELSASDSYDIPAGYIFPDEIYLNNETEDSQLDLNYYQLYTMSSDYLRCTYDLSFSDNIKSMDVIWDNYDAFREEPQIYNYDKEAWENLKDADLVNNPNQYVSKDRKIMLGAEVYSDTYVTLPKLSLKGGR